MLVWGGVDALMLSLGHMGWACGNILRGVGMPSLILLVLRWVMALGPSFSMTFDVGSFSNGNLYGVFLHC